MRKFVFLLVLLAIVIPIFASAQIQLNLNYPEFGGITLDKATCDKIVAGDPSVAGKICGQNLNIVAWLYYLIVGISGLAAFVMLVWGGVQWLTSGAIPSQAGEARDKLKSAVLGLLLILSSFLIIQVINPELTVLNQAGLKNFFGQVPAFNSTGSGGSLNLTVDGQQPYLCIPGVTSATVNLDWLTLGISGCQATSGPDATLWTGSKPDNGPESVTIPTTGLFQFTLDCSGVSKNVGVDVMSGACTAPLNISLTGRDIGDPPSAGVKNITYHRSDPTQNDIPSGELRLDWSTSIFSPLCWTSGGIGGQFDQNPVITPLNQSFNLVTSPAGTYTYNFDCVATSGAASDSITLTIIN